MPIQDMRLPDLNEIRERGREVRIAQEAQQQMLSRAQQSGRAKLFPTLAIVEFAGDDDTIRLRLDDYYTELLSSQILSRLIEAGAFRTLAGLSAAQQEIDRRLANNEDGDFTDIIDHLAPEVRTKIRRRYRDSGCVFHAKWDGSGVMIASHQTVWFYTSGGTLVDEMSFQRYEEECLRLLGLSGQNINHHSSAFTAILRMRSQSESIYPCSCEEIISVDRTANNQRAVANDATATIADIYVDSNTLFVVMSNGLKRYGTVEDWITYCKNNKLNKFRNIPVIKGSRPEEVQKLYDEAWTVSGVDATKYNCSSCGNKIQNIPHLLKLHEFTGYCLRCATSSGKQFHERLYSDPMRVAVATTDTLGIELECNPSLSILLSARNAGWGIKPDGSLRGLSAELVSPILTTSNVEESTAKVVSSGSANLNNRCGYHVWVGSKHLKYPAIGKLARLCAAHEQTFSRMVSPSREPQSKSDNSGRPIKMPRQMLGCPFDKNGIIKLFYGTDNLVQEDPHGNKVLRIKESKRCNDRRDDAKPWLNVTYPNGILSRYQWVNFHGHFYRGAIEIRLHQGTMDAEKIVNWAMLWHHIINEIDGVRADKLERIHPLDLVPKWLSSYYTARIKFYDKMQQSESKWEDFKDIQIIEGNREL